MMRSRTTDAAGGPGRAGPGLIRRTSVAISVVATCLTAATAATPAAADEGEPMPADLCLPGFSSPTGSAPCTPAPPGSYVAVAGATSAQLCPPGYFVDAMAAVACIAAPIDAPGGRVVEVPLATPSPDHWLTLVPERPDVVLSLPALVGDELLVPVGVAAVDSLERWSLDGRLLGTVDGLGVVSIAGLTVDRSADPRNGRVFVTISSFESPTTVWRLADGDLTRWSPAVPAAEALAPLTVTRTSYPSLDGTEIGLFVIHRADVTPGPDVPLILNGYGGFAISESPGWMPNLAAWCAEGGVWAIAGLRGGYEHGQSWHDAGRRANKQTVFDDFHSAGDWLVAQGMASHEHLGVVGGSNGGLLVGAALTQRPDLAQAVWCAVPLLDMVRYPQFLIARLWADEYGDPDVPEEFGWLCAYSPYHQVEHGVRCPSVLFTTAEGDTRVDPLHARKMAALLQSVNADPTGHPVYLLQAGRAGHGVGKPASMRVAEGVDVLSFLAGQLGLRV